MQLRQRPIRDLRAPLPVGPPEGPRLPAGWALYLMFGGLFVWWFLGLSGFVQAIFAVPLLVTLVARRGGVAMPRAFWLWLLFLAFMFASASQLSDANNALSWGWRMWRTVHGQYYVHGHGDDRALSNGIQQRSRY